MQQETEVKNIHQQISELVSEYCDKTGICVTSVYIKWLKNIDNSKSFVEQVEVTANN